MKGKNYDLSHILGEYNEGWADQLKLLVACKGKFNVSRHHWHPLWR